MRILIDVNMSPSWVDYLRAAGHEAMHWTAIGDAGAPDDEILRYAQTYDLVILTRDLDFGALLATSGAHRPSVIQFRGNRQFPHKIGPRVTRLLEQAAGELRAGAFVSIDLAKTRIRLLPLRRQ